MAERTAREVLDSVEAALDECDLSPAPPHEKLTTLRAKLRALVGRNMVVKQCGHTAPFPGCRVCEGAVRSRSKTLPDVPAATDQPSDYTKASSLSDEALELLVSIENLEGIETNDEDRKGPQRHVWSQLDGLVSFGGARGPGNQWRRATINDAGLRVLHLKQLPAKCPTCGSQPVRRFSVSSFLDFCQKCNKTVASG